MAKKKRIVICLLLILLIFRIIVSVRMYINTRGEWKNEKREITIICVEKITEDGVTYTGKIGINKVIFSVRDVNNIYAYGDKICVLCSNYSIVKDNNPYELDYRLYLKAKGINSRLVINKVIFYSKGNNLITAVRNSMSKVLDERLGRYSSIAKSLMYGEDAYLDEDFKEKCRNIGIGHMMCVSGTHVMYLILSFENITKSKKKNILNLVIILYFYIISLFSISLLRVVIMYVLCLIFPRMEYNKKICFALYIVLVINPFYIFNIGIIFSYLSVISIRVFNPVILSFIKVRFKITNIYLSSNIAMSISSQILILPFEVYYFGKLIPICILSNIVLSMGLNALMQFLFYSFILLFVPFVSTILLKILYCFIYLFCSLVNVIYELNVFNISLPRINLTIFLLYYLVIFILMYKSKIAIVYFWKYRKIVKNILNLVIVFAISYCVIWYVYTMYFESYVIYFNVGQGNMCLIHKGVSNVIVDCGSTQDKKAAGILKTFLDAKNITNIDLILITHMHADHMNGVSDIALSGINVDRVGFSIPCMYVAEYEELKNALKRENVGIISLVQQDNICINDIHVQILSPPKDCSIKDNDMLNANSTVFLIHFLKKRLLFMGDSTKNTEKYLLNKYGDYLKNIDLYQVSHHGSKTSSLKEFVLSLDISNAIISSKEAVYGHPDKEVLDLFNTNSIKVWQTEKLGAIIF